MVTTANAGGPTQSVGLDMNTVNVSSDSWSGSSTIIIFVVHRVMGLPLGASPERKVITGDVTEISFADAEPANGCTDTLV